jgi:hypothetical protein
MEGVSEEDAQRRLLPMNSLSWMVGHLAWQEITAASDPFLDTLTTELLLVPFTSNGRTDGETAGTRLQRTIYHYFYHTGEAQAVRQLLGHTGVGSFIGDFGEQWGYRPAE